MKTEDIIQYTKQYIEFLETYNRGDILPQYVMPIEHDMEYSDFPEAFLKNPKGMKRLSKSKLSDNTTLRIFRHVNAEDCIAVVEYKDGRLSWNSADSEELLKSLYHARLPEEFVFSIVQEPGQDMSITIIPKYIADYDYRDKPTQYDLDIGEMEPMWNTQWFRPLFNNYLSTSAESIFTASDDTKTMVDMKQILENNGLIYDLDLEEESLNNINLSEEHGASYVSKTLVVKKRIKK